MTTEKFNKILTNVFTSKELKENVWKVAVPIKFLNGKNIDVVLKQEGTKLYLIDNKCTLKYMNEMYELTSQDVKSCVSNVVKLHEVKILSGELVCETNEKDLPEDILNFVMCINQLTNMFVFFDKPE